MLISEPDSDRHLLKSPLFAEASRDDAFWGGSRIGLPTLASPTKKLRRIPCALKQDLVDTAASTKGMGAP